MARPFFLLIQLKTGFSSSFFSLFMVKKTNKTTIFNLSLNANHFATAKGRQRLTLRVGASPTVYHLQKNNDDLKGDSFECQNSWDRPGSVILFWNFDCVSAERKETVDSRRRRMSVGLRSHSELAWLLLCSLSSKLFGLPCLQFQYICHSVCCVELFRLPVCASGGHWKKMKWKGERTIGSQRADVN